MVVRWSPLGDSKEGRIGSGQPGYLLQASDNGMDEHFGRKSKPSAERPVVRRMKQIQGALYNDTAKNGLSVVARPTTGVIDGFLLTLSIIAEQAVPSGPGDRWT